jgi:hypothetical protein
MSIDFCYLRWGMQEYICNGSYGLKSVFVAFSVGVFIGRRSIFDFRRST